ncbi:calpain-B-like [Crassostrea virginica]|uniref:Calpain-B-like n=2 Tax=Crassostrea virginica TaxID=6565 RepID=A0A8B8EAN3_CRAVI|nr:calpain-B-like isoform X1 [Crassostrea virginica]XP_022338119.1 calpain-B-like [Crassostrea virginica]
MGSSPSKVKEKRSQSVAEVRILANGHVPPRRTVSTLSRVAEVTGIEKRNPEQPVVEFPQEEYKDGKLGITSKDTILTYLDSLDDEELFCDPDFNADRFALFYSDKDASCFQWKRPVDLVEEWQTPQLMVDGVTRDDIKQGTLGDCWFLSACAAVSQKKDFMKKIVPSDQPLCGPGYRGVVHFRFWRFGDWVDVYIDDRLPTVYGKLVYGRCTEPQEFWVALIEKAYAKLHGSYEAIEGGQAMDALVDLTGGIPRLYEIQDKDPFLYRMIEKAQQKGAFITCSRKGNWKLSTKADPNGLVSGHAYTVTEVRKIKHVRGEDKLVRVRNPWGDNNEWKGSWSDSDVNWTWVDEQTKKEIGLQARDDGEFWMSYRDFCKQFQEVTICQYGPNFDGTGTVDKFGCYLCVKGRWECDRNAGGSRNNLQKFATNPQYILTLPEADDFDPQKDDPDLEGLCSIVISLMQEHRQSTRNVKVKKLQIGFFLYRTDEPTKRLSAQHFRYTPDSGKSGVYINYREVSQQFELEPGHYVLIPSTFHHNEAADYMLRVFGEKTFTLEGPLE